MKTIKLIVIMITSLSILAVTIPMMIGQPIVLDIASEPNISDTTKYANGDVVQPFKTYNFDQGKWSAYLIVSGNDADELPEEMPDGKRFKTEDKAILKEMQKWKFIYSGGDMATVGSELILFHDGKRVFRSGIVISKNTQGLQNQQYGWLEALPKDELVRQLSHFRVVRWPIILK